MSNYSVIGPLYVPSSKSGVSFPTCPHHEPDSCPSCDGSRLTAEQMREAVTPPCMRPGWTVEKQRAQEARWAAERAARLASLHPTYVEEAS